MDHRFLAEQLLNTPRYSLEGNPAFNDVAITHAILAVAERLEVAISLLLDREEEEDEE